MWWKPGVSTSPGLVWYMHWVVTDGRTDGETDRITTANTRLALRAVARKTAIDKIIISDEVCCFVGTSAWAVRTCGAAVDTSSCTCWEADRWHRHVYAPAGCHQGRPSSVNSTRTTWQALVAAREWRSPNVSGSSETGVGTVVLSTITRSSDQSSIEV